MIWKQIDDYTLPIRFEIIPFQDDTDMSSSISSLGNDFDCFIGSSSSIAWNNNCNILDLCGLPYRIGVPYHHRLAGRKKLTWEDLHHERLMLVKYGDSPVLNKMREDIAADHPAITIIDTPFHYDFNTFNECVQMNYLLGTMDVWANIHPSIYTLPVDWGYTMAYSIVYTKNPSEGLQLFVDKIKENIDHLDIRF